MDYKRKVQQITKIAESNKYPPEFNPSRWIFVKCNCYAYALDIPVSDRKQKIWIPGCISDEQEETHIFSVISLTDRLKRDLRFLGISYKEEREEKHLSKGYRVAVYFIPAISYEFPIGFHFVRQDADGTWSEKTSWKGKIRKIGERGNTPPDLTEHGARFVTVLILS